MTFNAFNRNFSLNDINGLNNKTRSNLSKYNKAIPSGHGSYVSNDSLKKKHLLLSDLKQISTKLNNEGDQLYFSKTNYYHKKTKDINNNNSYHINKVKSKSKKRPVTSIIVGLPNASTAKSSMVNSPCASSKCVINKSNYGSNNSTKPKQTKRLKLFYRPNEERESKTYCDKKTDKNYNKSLIASTVQVMQSNVYHKRLEECKDQQQCRSTSSLNNIIVKAFKSQNNSKEKISQKVNGISPKIREKMIKCFLIKNKAMYQRKSNFKPIHPIDRKDSMNRAPLNLKNTKINLQQRNAIKDRHVIQSQIKIPSQKRNEKKVLCNEDEKKTHIHSSKQQTSKTIVISINENNDINEDETNVIVTTINNQYDNNSIGQLPIYASKHLFYPNDNEYLSQSSIQQFFSIPKLLNTVLQYLKVKDIVILSSLSKDLNKKTKEMRYSLFKSLILSSKPEHIHIHDNIWKQLLNYTKLGIEIPLKQNYNENALKPSSYLIEIKKDILRTYPNEPYFNENSVAYSQLSNILKSYSNYNTNIGYAQGMNFITAKILHKYQNEEMAFLILDAIINRLHMENIIGVSNNVAITMHSIGNLIKNNVSNFYSFLTQNNLTHELCTANWVLTLFSNSISYEELYIVWEFIIIFGWEFINGFVIAIIDTLQETIMSFCFDNFSEEIKLLLYSDLFKKQFERIIDLCFNYMLTSENNKLDL